MIASDMSQTVQSIINSLPGQRLLVVLAFAPLVLASSVIALFHLKGQDKLSLPKGIGLVVVPAGGVLFLLFTVPSLGRLMLQLLGGIVVLMIAYTAASVVYYLTRIEV